MKLDDIIRRLGHVETGLAHVRVQLAEHSVRFDWIESRLDRIEKRLDSCCMLTWAEVEMILDVFVLLLRGPRLPQSLPHQLSGKIKFARAALQKSKITAPYARNPKLVLPILAAAADENSEDLQDLWARLWRRQ